MKKALVLSSILLTMLTLNGCDWFDDDSDTTTTSGSGGSAANNETASNETASQQSTTRESAAWYRGRTNGNRPTWYYAKKMSAYPRTFTLNIPGCRTGMVVSNNGHRWEYGGYLVKQSDISGRGMTVLAPSSCNPSDNYITY